MAQAPRDRKMLTRWQTWALVGALVTLIVLVLWYALENPRNQTFGNTVTQVPVQQKVVALTFDDGPNPPYTDEIVDYLHAQHVNATFFVVGRAVALYPSSVRKEVQYGDAIGNHSWDHAHLVLERRPHIDREISMTDQAIWQATGRRTRLFRPPFGARDYAVISEARRMGYQVIMWSVPLAKDWQRPAPQVICDRVLPYVKDGSIIVLHDGNRGRGGDRSNTVAATKLIVQALRDKGFRFVTIPELLQLGYMEHENGASPTAAE